jgi:O-antigen/teichoic acid export membrane protein
MKQRTMDEKEIMNQKSDETENVNKSFQKIAKGGIITLIGTIVGTLLGFASRVIIVRYTSQSEYGVYSLALVLIGIFATISTLGFHEGSARYIAYFRGKNEEDKLGNIISSSIKIAIIASISLAIFSFFISDYISISIFHVLDLSIPLKIFSITIPFTVLINVFTAIFRGFDQVKPRIYFQNILRNFSLVIFLIIFAYLGLSFFGVVYAYLLSILVTCLAFTIYFIKKLPIHPKEENNINFPPMGKKLLLFSLPLLATGMLIMVMSWMDTLMLGYFKTPDVVGVYNVALPLATQILIVINSFAVLYIPIVSGLYGKNQMENLGRIYTISTKWCFIGTLPILFVVFLFPDVVLNLFFGGRYIGAVVVLQILAFGFFLNPISGLNYHTLIAIGKTKTIMKIFLISGVTNIILNVILIPPLGIVGAAIASASAVAFANVMLSVKLYQFSKIHPLSRNYLKSILLSIAVIFVFFIISRNFITVNLWMLLTLFVLFLLTYIFLLFVTKSFDDEDIMLLLEIERKSGRDFTLIKKLLKKFI